MSEKIPGPTSPVKQNRRESATVKPRSAWRSLPKKILIFSIIISMSILLLSQLLGRVFLPMLNEYRHEVEKSLSSMLNAEVRIDEINTYWDVFIPYIEAKGVTLQPKTKLSLNTQAPLVGQKIQSVSAGINLIKMFKAKSFYPNSLEVKGLELFILKNNQGHFSMPGMNVPKRNESVEFEKYINKMLRHKNIVFSDAKIRVFNQTTGSMLNISPIELDYHSGDLDKKGLLTWVPNGDVAKKASVKFNLNGDLREPAEWVGALSVDIPPLDMDMLKPYLPNFLNIESGYAGIKFDLETDRMRVQQSTGKLDIKIGFVDKTLLTWNTPISITNQANRYTFRAQEPIRLGDKYVDVLKDAGLEIGFEEYLQFGLYGADLDLSTLPKLLNVTSQLSDQAAQNIRQLQLSGNAKRMFLGWDALKGWGALCSLDQVKLLPYKGFFGITSESGVSAEFSYFNELGQLSLKQQSFDFTYPNQLDGDFKIKELTTELYVKNDSVLTIWTDQFLLNTDSVKVSGDAKIQFKKGESPYLSVHAQGRDGVFAHVPKFVPVGVTGPHLISWFKQAFIRGDIQNIDVQIDGHVNELINPESDAVLNVKAQARNATFSFLKKWPELHNTNFDFELNKNNITVTSDRAHTRDLTSSDVKVEIPDLSTLILQVDLKLDSQNLEDVFAYAQTSPLNKYIGALVNNFEGRDEANVHASIKAPLYKKLAKGQQIEVSGDVLLKGASLYMPAMDMQVEDIHGSVAFTDKSIKAKKITAHINGSPAVFSAKTVKTAKGNRAHLLINSTAAPEQILKDKLRFITQHMRGATNWATRVDFGFQKDSLPPRLSVTSDLKGLEMRFPQPLGKPKNIAKHFKWTMSLSQLAKEAYLNINDELEAAFLFDAQYRIEKGQINYQRGPAVLNKNKGLWLNAAFETLDVSEWLVFLNQSFPASEQGAPDTLIKQIDVFSRRVNVGERYVEHIISFIKPTPNGWQIDLESMPLSGTLKWAGDKNHLKADLKHVDLRTIKQDKKSELSDDSPVNPSSFPSIEASVDRIIYDAYEFKNLTLTGKPEPKKRAWVVDQYTLNDDELRLFGSAAWVQNEQLKDYTTLNIQAKALPLDRALQKFGVYNVVKKSKVDVSARLNWAAALYAPSLPTLSGGVSLTSDGGVITAVQPGGAKLLGLFNAKSLPKRLAFDFNDLGSKGFKYEKAHAAFKINKGIATAKDFKLTSNVGELYIKGRIDLVRQTVNQVAIFNPELSSVLPITGGAVGGVPGFLGGVVLERLIKLFGGSTDEIAQIRYAVKGPWSSPVIEPTSVKTVKELTPAELAARTKKIQEDEASESGQ